MNYMISLAGVFFLIFRIWLAEFKLVEELQFRRHYLSRVVNLFVCLAIVMGFTSIIFNTVVIVCFPVMILTFVWDFNFFRMFGKRSYWKDPKNKKWVLIERLTLHPPILLIGLWMYIVGITGQIEWIPREESFYPYVIAMFLVYTSFFVFDERWTKRYNYPQAVIMICLMVGSCIVILLVGLFVIHKINYCEIFGWPCF